jgi:hypothetical protein
MMALEGVGGSMCRIELASLKPRKAKNDLADAAVPTRPFKAAVANVRCGIAKRSFDWREQLGR